MMGVFFLVFIFFEVECMVLKRIKIVGNFLVGIFSIVQRLIIILFLESYIIISNLYNEF